MDIDLANMNDIYFTADNHFGHENIIKFCDRPFSNIDEMNQVMVDNWNSVIEDHMTVYHLGDLTLEGYAKAVKIIEQLNGKIYFVSPSFHHDKRWLSYSCGFLKSRSENYSIILPSLHLLNLQIPNQRALKITLCHYPFDEWEASFHGALHFHGHTHNRLPEKKNRVDVGVDKWNFTPVSLKTLLEYCEVF